MLNFSFFVIIDFSCILYRLMDIERYRQHRRTQDFLALTLVDTVARTLADEHNILLWRGKIEQFLPEQDNGGFSYFLGWARQIVDQAADVAQHNDQQRFLANDLEYILKPWRVENLLDNMIGKNDVDRLALAQQYLEEQYVLARFDRTWPKQTMETKPSTMDAF